MTALTISGGLDRLATADLDALVPAASVRMTAKIDTRAWVPNPPGVVLRFQALELWLDDPLPSVVWIDSSPSFNSQPAASALPFTAGLHWIDVELVFDDGSGDHTVTVRWSDDATDDPDAVTWTSLGTTTLPGTTDLLPGQLEVAVGGTLAVPGVPALYLIASFEVDGVKVAEPAILVEAEGTTSFVDSEDPLVTWALAGPDAAIVPYPESIQPVLLGGAIRAAQVNAPLIRGPGDTTDPLRGRLLRLPELEVIAQIDKSRGDQGREQRNATGSGSLILQLDDPVAALVRKNDLLQTVIDGQVAFTFLAEDMIRQIVATENESGETVTISGRGHLALLELGTVFPSRGPGALPIERDRVFKWTAEAYDASSWPNSISVGSAEGAVRTPLLQQGPPEVAAGYPVPGATWRASPGDTQTMAPTGSVYYRGENIAIPTTREYVVLWGADNFGELYAGGQQVDTLPRPAGRANYLEGHALPITLSAGSITFAARVVNVGAGVPGNPVGFYWTLITLDQDGNLDEVIATADGTWLALGRPATEPGMTPGEVARITLSEWQARAAILGLDIPAIELSCTDQLDSGGQPWLETPNISTKVSNDLLTFYTEISATYWEMRMRPASLVLDLFVKGTNPISGVAYTTAPANNARAGNMRSLVRRET